MTQPARTTWKPVLVHAEVDYALGYCGPIFAVVWRQETTVEGARHLSAAFGEFATNRDRSGLVTVIEADASLPSSEARNAVAQFLRSISRDVAVSAVVYEGAGFKSAAVRGVVTGLTMLAKQSYPHRVFPTLEEASSWYAERAPFDWDLSPKQFINVVTSIRSLIPHQSQEQPQEW